MCDLNEDNIKTLGKLCRIEIADEEVPGLVRDLKRVLEYVSQLGQADVSGLSPYSHMEEHGIGSLRNDEVGPCLSREAFLANAPDQVGGMIRVPIVIKQ